jgi:hypothetical protein
MPSSAAFALFVLGSCRDGGTTAFRAIILSTASSTYRVTIMLNRRILLSLTLSITLPSLALGQAKAPTPEQLREMAADAMKKAEAKDAHVASSDNLIVAATMPEAKVKALAESLQKTYALASKVLKFQDEEVKAMRIVMYVFDEVDNFRQFQRSVLKVRPDDSEFAIYDVRSDTPYIVVSARRGERNPKFDVMAGNELCRALIAKKGGNARLTEWMKDGFARAVQMRSNPSSVGTDRSMVARMAPRLPKNAKANPVVDKAWSGSGKDKDLVAASLMDFLTFGPGAEKLDSILNGLIPSDGNDNPSIAMALMGADWMLADLDRAWRDWIAKGSPANK